MELAPGCWLRDPEAFRYFLVRVTFDDVHIEDCSCIRRQGRNQFHYFIVAHPLYRGGFRHGQRPRFRDVVTEFQCVRFTELHQRSIDKDPSGPAFKRTGALVGVQFLEQGYKPLLKHVFGRFPVSHIAETDCHHLRGEPVKKPLLGSGVTSEAPFDDLIIGY